MPTNVPNISVLRPDEYTIGRAASPANVHAEFQQLVARANLLLHHLREHRGDIDEQVVGLQAAIARVVTLEATVIDNARNIQENYDFLYDTVQDVEIALGARITALEETPWSTNPVLTDRTFLTHESHAWREGQPTGETGSDWRWAHTGDSIIAERSVIQLVPTKSCVIFRSADMTTEEFNGRVWRVFRSPFSALGTYVCKFDSPGGEFRVELAQGQCLTLACVADGGDNDGYMPISLNDAWSLAE